MTALIGISGKIGCGKSTLSSMLAERLGWRVMSFGGLLKDEVASVFQFPREWCDTPEGKRRKVQVPPDLHRTGAPGSATVRQLLQYWGTDVCRAKDPDYWTRLLAERLELGSALCAKVGHPSGSIVDDVRFPNEARMILGRGGILIRLDPYPGWEAGPGAEHASETALDEWGQWTVRLAPMLGELGLVAGVVTHMVTVDAELKVLIGTIPGAEIRTFGWSQQ